MFGGKKLPPTTEYERGLVRSEVLRLRFVTVLEIAVKVVRLLSLRYDEIGALRYEISPLNADTSIEIESYLDSGIKNNDANWDEHFWNTLEISSENNCATILAETKRQPLKCKPLWKIIFL